MTSNFDSSEVLEKIGRNVLSFQKIEGMLKALAASPNYSGSLEQIKEQRNKHHASLKMKSFGLVAKDFFSTVYPMNNDHEDIEGLFGFSMKIRGGDRERLIADIEKIVKERNDLIHHRLLQVDLASAENCEELIRHLDEQNSRLQPVYENVKSLLELMIKAREIAAEKFGSGNH